MKTALESNISESPNEGKEREGHYINASIGMLV